MAESLFYNKCCNVSISNVFYGFGNYGTEWNLKKICTSIEDQNEELQPVLQCFAECGVYDMLVALTLLVKAFASEDCRNWFCQKLEKCTDSSLIFQMSEKLHQKLTSDEFFCREGLADDPEYYLSEDLFGICEFLWENFSDKLISKTSRMHPRNLGLWHLGLYARVKDSLYYEKLENQAFPYLVSCGKDIQEFGCEENVRENLLRKVIADFLVELFLQNWNYNIEMLLNSVLKMDVESVAELDVPEYREMILNLYKDKYGHSLYISDRFCDLLCEMLQISKFFGDPGHRENILQLQWYLPFFYQLLGREDEARDLLIDMKEGLLVRQETLLVFYRDLLITKDEQKRIRLNSIFYEIYCDNSGVREFIHVAENINTFVKKFSKDVLERNRADLEDPFFISENEKLKVELLSRWFLSGKLCDTFQSLLDTMKGKTGFEKSDAIEKFISLFYSMCSHKESMIRFIPYWGRKIIGDDYPWDSGDEVWGIHNESERLRSCELVAQMEKCISHMPNYRTQQIFLEICQRIEKHWKIDAEGILCEKLMSAFRGIQSDPYNKWEYDSKGNKLRVRAEDSINNLVAFFLRGYYGEENVHREEPQGFSKNGEKLGKIDILLYQNGKEFMLQEAIKLSSMDHTKLNDHMNRMLNHYDTQGLPVTCFVIYAYVKDGAEFAGKVDSYLKEFLKSPFYHYQTVEPWKKVETGTACIFHHVLGYRRVEMLQKMHVFTVLMQ